MGDYEVGINKTHSTTIEIALQAKNDFPEY